MGAAVVAAILIRPAVCVCYTPVTLQFKCLLQMTSITVLQHWVMHVGYGVLDHGLCMMECTCVATSHI